MRAVYLVTLFVSSVTYAIAAEVAVPMNTVNEQGTVKAIGSIKITELPNGLVFTPVLEGLPAGEHGFHLHENPNCEAKEKEGKMTPALAAGGHYDPKATKKHAGPEGSGHLGDLPKLVVNTNGKVTESVMAPRLRMEDVKGRALVIHAGGDNYSDQPEPLGGGKGRIACGIIGN
ncbi:MULTISPECIES: superoxide dismutase family protein [Methylomicrobium]|uniref:Cu/Zn superoxide dismutase n=1 Tax=Methylomicrobium album BG8 TaxID=686340 RepID=H8GNJ6_METAL|nr:MULTISPECIES: superoxide dismutase family protein [Methylomicrobium]EIC29589.1 Cu/Zn superoxide dismutase [Methylomicrobium album BG8]